MKGEDLITLEAKLAEGDWWEIHEHRNGCWMHLVHFPALEAAENFLMKLNRGGRVAVIVRVQRTVYRQPQADSGEEQ